MDDFNKKAPSKKSDDLGLLADSQYWTFALAESAL